MGFISQTKLKYMQCIQLKQVYPTTKKLTHMLIITSNEID